MCNKYNINTTGTVVIYDIMKDVQAIHNFIKQDLLCAELHPQYTKEKMFVVGDRKGQLILRTRGLFSSKNKMIHSGEGSIYAIKWRTNLIAWANYCDVKLHDVAENKPVAHINRGTKESSECEMCKCCLCWENDETLLIGWTNLVKICKIRTVRTPRAQRHFIKEAHVFNVFSTDFDICGIAPFKENLVLLGFDENGTYNEDEDEDRTNNDTNEDNKDDDKIESFMNKFNQHLVNGQALVHFQGNDRHLKELYSTLNVPFTMWMHVKDAIGCLGAEMDKAPKAMKKITSTGL